jgi:cholesterol oxidase
VFSAGVLGTLRLLFKQKFDLGTLPNLSDQLGANLRTNSESLCGIAGIPEKMNHGVAISRVFNPDEHTHIELVKYPDRSGAMGLLAVMAAGDGPALMRTLSSFWSFISHPLRSFRVMQKDFAKYSIILLVMQSLDNALKVEWKRGIFGKSLHVKDSGGERAPAYIPIGQEVMHRYAEKSGGVAMNNMGEVFLNMSSTAHILGGCPMGKDASTGVVNDRFEVHGYPNMRILDGSIVPCNLGVNPSLTITALSEYAMSLVPQKEGSTSLKLEERMAANA